MKNLSLTVFFLGYLSSCASNPGLIGPDGTPHELISCENFIESCYTKAREACNGNYKIINSTSGHGLLAYSTSFDLLIKCDNPVITPVRAEKTPVNYEECNELPPLEKDRCREAVFAKSKKSK